MMGNGRSFNRFAGSARQRLHDPREAKRILVASYSSYRTLTGTTEKTYSCPDCVNGSCECVLTAMSDARAACCKVEVDGYDTRRGQWVTLRSYRYGRVTEDAWS